MLAELIPKVAEMSNEDDHEFYPRPSSAGPQKCIRQMVYHGLKIAKSPMPGRAIVLLNDSSFHEDLTNDWIRKTAFKLHSEQMEVDCRHPMKKGKIDGIITDILGIDRLYEHKAINHFTFNMYWDGELPLDYLTQCSIYIDAIKQHLNSDINQGVLLIKNKNTAQYIEFEIEYSLFEDTLTVIRATRSTGETRKIDTVIPHIIQDATDKFNSVLAYIEKKTLPKRQYHINDDWQCGYCQWCQTCWNGYEKEFNELQTDVDLPNELADMVRYYRETGAHITEMEKEYDDLKTKVKTMMTDLNVRQGRAGEYLLKLSLIKQRRIDKELLTPTEIDRATKETFYEKLSVTKPKEKNNVDVQSEGN